jgi:hypothetical protein
VIWYIKGGTMNIIYNSVLIAGLLVFAFYFWIIPTSNVGKNFLNKMQAKTEKDLAKWKRRQQMLYRIERHTRLP